MTKVCPVMPVVIAYRSYPWIRVGVQSFRRHFPLAPLLIVDNNPDDNSGQVLAERRWLTEWVGRDIGTMLEKSQQAHKGHGSGMDVAATWCRQRGIRWMLHFEPDCLITGVTWAWNLIEATRGDILMAGSHRWPFGPIHPTPSIWDVGRVRHSFEIRLRGDDEKHPQYRSLMDIAALDEHRMAEDKQSQDFWKVHWDTSQKAWFEAEKEGKTVLVGNGGDFRHFWGGSRLQTDPKKSHDTRVLEYL